MPLFAPFHPGTITLSNGSTAIVGTGTDFTVYPAGSLLTIPGVGSVQIAADPTDPEAATASTAWQGGPIADAPYDWTPPAPGAVLNERTRTLIEMLANGNLSALAGLASAADMLPYFDGAGTAALASLTAAARSILDDASTGAMRTTLGVGTTDIPQFAGINIGAATDTTLARVSAGNLSVEGNLIYRAGGTDVPVADGGTGASDAATARTNLGISQAIIDKVAALPLGSAAAPAVAGTGDPDTGLYFGGANSLSLVTGAADRLVIDSGGRVITPYRPFFSASKSAGFAAVIVANYDVVASNIGGHFNATSGMFTAPVAGRYHFEAGIINATTNGNTRAAFAKNGTEIGPAAFSALANEVLHFTCDAALAANDSLYVYLSLGSSQGGAAYNTFSGFLVG